MELTAGAGGSGFTVSAVVFEMPPNVAVRVTSTGLVPRVTSMGAVPNVWACETVPVAGTRATAVFWLARVTVTPPVGAGPSSSKSTFERSCVKSRTLMMARFRRGVPTVSIVVLVVPAREAVSVTAVSAATGGVGAENPVAFWPAGAGTVAGTLAGGGVLLGGGTRVAPAAG